MPTPADVIRFNDIKGWTPSIDPRSVAPGSTFVLSGRNYLFDSRGPRSAFGSRLLAHGDAIIAANIGGDVQSLGGFIFTTSSISRFTDADTRVVSYSLAGLIIGANVRRRWTRAFVGGVSYFCHPGTGILKYIDGTWSTFDPGISGPQAIAESNGRLVVLGSAVVAWSSPDDPEDFTPELGGAGFQLISDRISGTPRVLIPMPSGYIIWTTQGGLVGEFIGGDLVFRHYVLEHKHRPINDSAIVQLPDGSYIFCTQQGLFIQDTGNQTVKPATPVFNEWFRERISRSPSGGLFVRLDYVESTDHLYVQIRDNTADYIETPVLSVNLDKWGMFSEPHKGIILHGVKAQPVEGPVGYVDSMGVARRFLANATDREVTPNEFVGLDSEIVLGPFRSENLSPFLDAIQEVHGISLSSHARPVWSRELQTTVDYDEGSTVIDLDTSEADDYDENSSHAAYPNTDYRVELIGDLSGNDIAYSLDTDSALEGVVSEFPMLIRETANMRQYSAITTGIWFRIIVSAIEPDEYFHMTYGSINVTYAGRLNS